MLLLQYRENEIFYPFPRMRIYCHHQPCSSSVQRLYHNIRMWSSIRRRWSIWSCRFDHFRRSLTWWRSSMVWYIRSPDPFLLPDWRVVDPGKANFSLKERKMRKFLNFPLFEVITLSHCYRHLMPPLIHITTNQFVTTTYLPSLHHSIA